MEDKNIVRLYWQRDSAAIEMSDRKYGRYCRLIAYDILKNSEDAEECMNDSYLAAWNSIPPQKPDNLGAYLCRIVRNMSINRLRERQSLKRGGGETALILEELENCVAASGSVEKEYEAKELKEAINRFLRTLSENDRVIFVGRYWLCLPSLIIAKRLNIKESRVNTSLHRSRKKLRQYLIEEGLL